MRVVGGSLRGRTLAAPKSQSIRPTADRLRESLFNILIHAYADPISGARVLDLFAGTGALGIEAMSRGAAFTLFVDDSAEARALLRENVATLGLGGVSRIFRRDATKLGPAHPIEPFALAFLDPPYGKGLAEQALASARAGGWLVPDALIVVEEATKAKFAAPEGFAEVERRRLRRYRVRRAAVRYSAVMPAALIAAPQVLISLATKLLQILRGAMLRRRQRRAEFAHALLHRWCCHGCQHRRVELGDDGGGVAFGRKIAFQLLAEKPFSPCSSAVAMSGNAGERSLPSTAGACTAWLCKLRHRSRDGRTHVIDAAGEQILHRRRQPAVRHVGDLDADVDIEQSAGEMRSGPGAGRAILHLGLVCLRVSDEVRQTCPPGCRAAWSG